MIPNPKWKGIQLNYDDLIEHQDDEPLLFCLSPVTYRALLALAGFMAWPTRYYSFEGAEIDRDIVDNWAANAEYELMTSACCGEIIALINQTTTMVAGQQQVSGEAQLQQMDDDYDGSTGSVAPDAVYDGSPTDDYRDEALCYALYTVIDATLDAIASDTENWKKETAMVAGAVAALGVTLAGFSAGISALVGTALAGGINLISQAYMASVSEDDLRDTDAREELLCLAYTRMEGATPTAASLQLAFAPDASIEDAAEKQRGILETVMGTLKAYFGFVRVMNEGVTIAQNVGLENHCVGCGTCGDWEYYGDMAVDAGGLSTFDVWPQYGGDQTLGEYESGVRWRDTLSPWPPVTDGFQGIRARRVFAAPAIINRVIINYDASQGVHNKGTLIPMGVQLLSGGAVVWSNYSTPWGDNHTKLFDVPGVTCDEIIFLSNVSVTDHPDDCGGGYVNMWWFRVCGDGVNPWE